jgi:hypothetical protein
VALRTLILDDFSGGWNPRDAPSELADNESPDCMNVSLDERGGVVKRLGLTRLGSGTTLTGAPSNLFFWQKGGVYIVQDGAVVRKTADFVNFTTLKTYSDTNRAAFCDFNGLLVAVHPTDRVSTYNNTTWTDLGGTSPRGAACATWKNRVWVTADPANQGRVHACESGTIGTWNDFVDLNELDGAPCTAIGAGQGMDVAGRGGLLVFKAHSHHRIHDSSDTATFGANTILHAQAGAGGPLSVAASPHGEIAFIGADGIYISDGVNTATQISAKLDPLFKSTQLNYAQTDKWCAGVNQDRFVFSMTRGTAQTTNNFTLEFHPEQGWVVPHTFGAAAFTESRLSHAKLYSASASAGKCFDTFVGGNDDGTAITARYHTKWFEPGLGYKCRLRRIRVEGRGDFSIYTKGDYTQSEGSLSLFATDPLGMSWGSGVWGSGIWGGELYEDYIDFWSLGVAKSVAFNLTETSSTSALGPKLLADGTAPEVGNFALYGITLDFVRLGYA